MYYLIDTAVKPYQRNKIKAIMSSKKQTQYGEGTSGMGKSARKDKKLNQLLCNNKCCHASKRGSKCNLKNYVNCNSTMTFWIMVKIFVAHANREDLLWLDNLLKDYENNVNGEFIDRQPNLNKNNEEEISAKQLLKKKLIMMNHSEIETSVVSPSFQPVMRIVFNEADGTQLIISRESLKSKLTKNHVEPVPEPSLCSIKIISYEFIARLIKWDDELSHLRGISPEQINGYLQKCCEEGCLEKINTKLQNLDKKILSYKKRGNYSVKKEEKTASMYRELVDIRLILEKYNKYVTERQHPYFMLH